MSVLGLAARGFDASAGWVKNHVPSRETIHRYRLLRPFARQLSQPNLWRLNHRSVPRAVAVGLAVGIIIPILHTFIAALVALPTRANVAVAAATTLVINPLTIPPLYYGAYRIGLWELRHDAMVDPGAAARVSGELGRMLFWLHEASGPIALGILTLAAGAAVLGYGLTALVWRLMVHSRWRQRRLARRAARGTAA
jgi:uncharacterized protein (DUF2062 family)